MNMATKYYIDMYRNERGRAVNVPVVATFKDINECRASAVLAMIEDPKIELVMVNRYAKNGPKGGRGSFIGNIQSKKGGIYEWYSQSGAAVISMPRGTTENKLPKPGRSSDRRNFKKFTADGFPIYKIWQYWDSDNGYNVLAKNNYGEWVYGRNYNIKTGRWAGGTYRVHINDLYDRSPPTGRLVVDNKRGNTGKY